MAQIQKCVLAGRVVTADRLARGHRKFFRILLGALLAAATLPGGAQKFYPDDPLLREPPPLVVAKPLKRDINEYYDFFQETFFEPDKQVKKQGNPPPSQAVNTLGEVPDSSWLTNRIGSRPITVTSPGS